MKVLRPLYWRWFAIWLIDVISGHLVNYYVINGQQLLHHKSEYLWKTPYFSYCLSTAYCGSSFLLMYRVMHF